MTISDINDNPPVADQPSYTGTVLEDSSVGTIITVRHFIFVFILVITNAIWNIYLLHCIHVGTIALTQCDCHLTQCDCYLTKCNWHLAQCDLLWLSQYIRARQCTFTIKESQTVCNL